ncbi:hypothetical protein HR060_10525 [Catenovulum sp. SM1970]|uniref:hypothetical protein n=1 Tax=Marinifaba aquimaris TaxID=2741323 RepID=UPI0015738B00|nr:hypothetical protein [Marinifaba aquimaris]NTS77299.1 hypothetical protein [Marinifaba aquimaris]
MAKPNAKLPTRTVDVSCLKCKSPLFKYHKNGKGNLVKCFKARIATDFTTEPCVCPQCHSLFARETIIRGMPAYKIIGGKVSFK